MNDTAAARLRAVARVTKLPDDSRVLRLYGNEVDAILALAEAAQEVGRIQGGRSRSVDHLVAALAALRESLPAVKGVA